MLTILIGKSCSGKNTIANELVKNFSFERIVTTTTRPMRKNEVDGVDYNFISKEQFLEKVKNGDFIEYRSKDTLIKGKQDISYYGSPKRQLEAGKNYVIILDVQGAKKFIDYYGKENCFVVKIEVDVTIRRRRAVERGNFDATEWFIRRLEEDEEFDYDHTADIVNFSLFGFTDIESIASKIYFAHDTYCKDPYKLFLLDL